MISCYHTRELNKVESSLPRGLRHRMVSIPETEVIIWCLSLFGSIRTGKECSETRGLNRQGRTTGNERRLDTATALAILFYDGDDPDPADMEKYHYVSNAIYGDLIEEIADISGKDPDIIYQAMKNELIKEDGLAEVTVSQTLQ